MVTKRAANRTFPSVTFATQRLVVKFTHDPGFGAALHHLLREVLHLAFAPQADLTERVQARVAFDKRRSKPRSKTHNMRSVINLVVTGVNAKHPALFLAASTEES